MKMNISALRYSVLLMLFIPSISRSQCTITLTGNPAGKDAMVHSLDCGAAFAMTYGWCDSTSFPDYLSLAMGEWTYWGDPAIDRAFIEFDLGFLHASGCTAENATLELTDPGYTGSYPSCGMGSSPVACNDNSMVANRVTSPWAETVTWITQPTVASTIPGVDYVTAPNDTGAYSALSLNLTDMVNFWLTYPGQNYGVRMSVQTETYYVNRTYASGDHPDVFRRPRLVLHLLCPDSCAGLLRMSPALSSLSMRVYPNPAHDLVTVSISETYAHADYKLADLCGRIVLEGSASIGDHSFSIDLSGLPQGIYVLSVQTPSGISSSRLVKDTP